MKELILDWNEQKKISGKLFGLFFEDINFSIDGGINSNQINNPRFGFRYRKPVRDFRYYLRKLKRYRKKVRYIEVPDFFRYWQTSGNITVEEQTQGGVGNRSKRYPLLHIDGSAALCNLGYNGGASKEKHGRYLRDNAGRCAIGVLEGHTYLCSFYVKNISFQGTLESGIECDAALLTEKAVLSPEKGDWTEVKFFLKAQTTGIGRFFVRFSGNGALSLDGFYFGDTDAVGYGDPVWSGGKLRRDLVEALKELRPAFVRFPGGCIVEGYNTGNSYYWKNTVGGLFDRKPQINLWGESQADGGYMQSYEVGFYEYFLLCEYLKAEPLPILNAGLACQGRSEAHISCKDSGFQRYIDDALDLIAFANGDPAANPWAALRAQMGHPAPFGLKMMGIGNENWGKEYLENFAAVKEAVKKRHPDIDLVWSAGWECYKSSYYELRRKGFDGVHDDCIVDDHFYRKPDWCIQNAALYDDYDRKARIFLGEYAANTPWDNTAMPNNFYSALAEAAFLTGIERNADKVIMSSYAPLFSRVGGAQWAHNLINFNSLYTLRTANFYVQKLFSNHYGASYLPSCAPDSDGVYTSATTDGKRMYVKIVNTRTSSEKVKIAIKNRPLTASAKTFTLCCTDDYKQNTLSFEGEPEEPLRPTEGTLEFSNGRAELKVPARALVVIDAE